MILQEYTGRSTTKFPFGGRNLHAIPNFRKTSATWVVCFSLDELSEYSEHRPVSCYAFVKNQDGCFQAHLLVVRTRVFFLLQLRYRHLKTLVGSLGYFPLECEPLHPHSDYCSNILCRRYS